MSDMNGTGQSRVDVADAQEQPQLLWVPTGAETVVLGQQVHTITPYLGLWLPAGTVPDPTPECAVLSGAAESPPALARHAVPVRIEPLVTMLLSRLGEEGVTADSRRLTAAMIADLLEPTDSPILVRLPGAPVLAPMVRKLWDDPGHPYSLEQWAEYLGVCSKTVTRSFHAETGLSFSRWRAVLRAREAVVQLSASAELVDVAEATGYHSVSAFGAAFRRVTGKTPGQFRPVALQL